MKKFKDRVAVVTGAGSGIGQATAIALARKGCHLALADVNEVGMQQTASTVEGLGRTASQHIVDVADKKAMENFAGEVIDAHGRANIVVNNAGIGIAAPFEDHSLEDLERIININLWGVIYGCWFFIPHLKKEDEAQIVNISSAAGIVPAPGMSSYCTTKFAVRGLSESIRYELDKYNIGVTSVHPGVINTNIPQATAFLRPEDQKKKAQGAKMFKRFGHSPEMAAEKIVAGIENNAQRVLIGAEAFAMDFMKRAFPVGTDRLLSKMGI